MATIGISGPSSYVQVGLQFFNHWADANTALGGGDRIVLAGFLAKSTSPITRAAFKGWYDEVLAERTLVSTKLVDLDLARGALEDIKSALVLRAGQFHKAVRGNAPGSRYERSLAALAQIDDTQSVFTDAMLRIRQVWTALNADTSLGLALPVTLEGNFPLEGFLQLFNGVPGAQPNDPPQVPGLRHRYEALTDLEGEVKLAREMRNDLQDRLYEMMKAYRSVLPQKFLEGHAILESMPVLTSPQGSPPAAVQVVVTFDTVSQKAKIVVQGAVPAGVSELEVRGVPGLAYSVEDEEDLGSIPLGGPLEFLTDTFHQAPGQSGTYRVYTKNSEGRESGSNTGSATRPV